jgi:hypothetical protein
VRRLEFKIWDLGCKISGFAVLGPALRVKNLPLRVDSRFRVWVGFWAWSSGFMVQDLKLRV